MKVHLVDGTYELFRSFFGAPAATGRDGGEVGAARGLAYTLLALVREPGVSHVAVAFDHVIESFRNELFAGYKRGDGVPPELMTQFPLAERTAAALGFVVWPMVEFEADDALAAGAERFASDPVVEQVVLCSPDKDLAQCVRGRRVVCLDRRQRRLMDEDAVRAKFGVAPGSIPDWLALVGDAADGIPGIPRWGAKSAATLLARYEHIEAIPDSARAWDVAVRGAAALAQNLASRREEAALYRRLATLRRDVPLAEDLEALRWTGPRRQALEEAAAELALPDLARRVGPAH